jgi:hypothetical protein
MIKIGLASSLALTLATALAAQQVNPTVAASHAANHSVVHYGKWLSAALAATLTGLAAREYVRSDDAYRQLRDICRADASQCAQNSSGTYVNTANEGLYQTSLEYQRRARARLLAGQVSLLLAAGLFLADHGREGSEPGNIPFHISVKPRHHGAQVGVRLTF